MRALAFAIACWPVADPLARYRAVVERGNDRLVEAHHQFWPSEEAMSEGSPQLILERGEAVERPPALIMQGTADDNLTPDMASNFAAAYTKAGGSIAFHKRRVSRTLLSRATRLRPMRCGRSSRSPTSSTTRRAEAENRRRSNATAAKTRAARDDARGQWRRHGQQRAAPLSASINFG